eukprot:c23018_g1_i1 orf=137-1540(+)
MMITFCSSAFLGTRLPDHTASANGLCFGVGQLRKRVCHARQQRIVKKSCRLDLRHEFVKWKLSMGLRDSPNASLWRRWSECPVLARPQLALPLIAPSDNWGMWSVLLSIGAFGIWSENTKLGSTLSGALVSTLVALFASNAGIIASESPAYNVVNAFLLPMSVPLLLYSADLRRVVASTGRLLTAFCLGSVATIIGTLVAMVVVPLHTLGDDGWKIAAALMSRHIGGAVNYVAVSEAFGISSSALTAGLAADNLICAIYFMTLFALASKVPVASSKESSVDQVELKDKIGPCSHILESATALAFSACICTMGVYLAQSFGMPEGKITCITAVVVLLATVFPSKIGALAPAGEALAIILVQVFFAVVGASGSIASVVKTAPSLFIFCLVQLSVHLAIILGVGRILGFDQKQLLLASNANVGGPTTAAGLATAKGWKDLVVPGILAGIFGIAIATFISIFLGVTVLRRM